MKRKLKQWIATLLLGIFIISEIPIQTFAAGLTPDKDTGEASGSGQQLPTEIDNSGAKDDTYLTQQDIGLRIYVTDAYGNVQKTNKGFDAIDFWYDGVDFFNTAKEIGNYGSNYLRCTVNPMQDYEIGTASIYELGFNSDYKSKCTKNKDCICQKEYFVDRHFHALTGPTRHHIREKIFFATESGEIRAATLMQRYWSDTLEKYLAQKQAAIEGLTTTEDIEMYMHVEVCFAIVHHLTDPNSPEWYGTIFEYGCHSDADNKQKLYRNYKSGKYKVYDADYSTYLPNAFYISNNFDCFSGFTYMRPASYQKGLNSSQLKNQAYGIYSMSFKTFIQNEVKTPEKDVPVSPDIEVKKEEATTIAKVENEEVEVRTGYAAQNGYYDIGTNAGIPTTEEIRNVIEAQDCIIDYGYVFEKYVPEKFPTVTYNFTYYVPCGCTREVFDHYEYDEEGNSHEVTRTETGYHGGQYHTGSLSKTIEIPRAAVYYRITDYKIYGLDTVFVQNQCSNVTYSNLSPIKDVTAVISGVTNPTDISKVAMDTHVDYSQVKNLTFTHSDVNGGIFSSQSAAENWIAANGFKYGNEKMAVPKAANDKLIIEFNDDRGTVELMDNKWCERPEMNSSHVVVTPTPVRNDAAKSQYQQIYRDEREHLEIPYALMNGNYYTTISSIYFLYAGTDKHGLYISYDYDAAPDHIVDETIDLKTSPYNSRPTVHYSSQEPIHVMTPIISPFHTNDSDRLQDLTEEEKTTKTEEEIKEYEREQSLTGTQLINEADCQQLRVDETYTLTFDPAMHQVWLGYGYSGLIDNENFWNGHYYEGELLETENKYDKYVAEKLVKFPFDVYIQNKLFAANTWICVYKFDKTTDTVSAGDIDKPLLRNVEYYVPSWALSSMDENAQGRGMIETRVLAVNFNGSDSHGVTYNPNDEQTWSTNAIDVQLSGWVYDFKITGTNDKMPWVSGEEYSEYWQGYQGASLSFSDRKEEFYMGLFNRLGEDNTAKDKAQRRDKDDSLDENISEKTGILPLSFGSSKYGIEQGTLGLGSEIAFTLKTMDDLSDTDKVVITPTYTYYSYDLSKKLTMDQMQLYYTNPATHEKYCLYGSDMDAPFLINRYTNKYNTSIFTQDELVYTAKHNSHADTKWFQGLTDKWINYRAKRNEVNIGSLSKVTLTDWAMVYSSPLSELKLPQYSYSPTTNNVERDEKTNKYENVLGSLYKDGNITLKSKEDALKQSVQQWNGHYYIPSTLKILDLTVLNSMGYATLQDYISENAYLTGTEEFWAEQNNGYLVLNFQITVYKDGQPYMTMESGSSDQWLRQGRKETIQINTLDVRRHALQIMKTNSISMQDALAQAAEELDTIIKIKSGDIAVINLSSHADKRFTTKAVAWS